MMAEPDTADLVETARRQHRHLEEDCWYCCSVPHASGYGDELHTTCDDTRLGKPCDCGADEANAALDALAQRLAEAEYRVSFLENMYLEKRTDQALRRFGEHDRDCPYLKHPYPDRCNCGLLAALTSTEEPEQ